MNDDLALPAVTRQPIVHVDGTPDEEYPLRILRAYRANCDVLWADHTGSEETTNPLLVAMNKHQYQRAEILERAIAKLLFWPATTTPPPDTDFGGNA